MRIAWAAKMIERTSGGHIEANYRRVWLLTALLEDYFQLRGLWYWGPKQSFSWLMAHDRAAFEAFECALQPFAKANDLQQLIGHVHGGRAKSQT